jgi:hypothetical protein
MDSRQMVVTLCGSVRFERDFKEAKLKLGLRGIIVIDLSTYPSEHEVSGRGADLDESYDKLILDLVHLQKIMSSDAVLIVGDGYIGKSTAREILWASMLDRMVVAQKGRNWDEIAAILKTRIHDDRGIIEQAREVLRCPI